VEARAKSVLRATTTRISSDYDMQAAKAREQKRNNRGKRALLPKRTGMKMRVSDDRKSQDGAGRHTEKDPLKTQRGR
jgi:hypothetical protein